MGFSPYPWSAPLNDIPAAAALVRRAAAKANIVIVLMHAGAEGAGQTHTPYGTQYFLGEDRGNVRAFAHAMVRAGADLVLGSGPHVIRGMERYRSRLIAYSLGNFAGWRNFALGGDLSLSGLLTVRITTTGRVLGGRWLSLRLASPGVPTLDGSRRSLRLVRSLSASDFARTWHLDSRGTSPGVEPLGTIADRLDGTDQTGRQPRPTPPHAPPEVSTTRPSCRRREDEPRSGRCRESPRSAAGHLVSALERPHPEPGLARRGRDCGVRCSRR